MDSLRILILNERHGKVFSRIFLCSYLDVHSEMLLSLLTDFFHFRTSIKEVPSYIEMFYNVEDIEVYVETTTVDYEKQHWLSKKNS